MTICKISLHIHIYRHRDKGFTIEKIMRSVNVIFTLYVLILISNICLHIIKYIFIGNYALSRVKFTK